MEKIPIELIQEIAKRLNFTSKVQLAQTCHRIHQILIPIVYQNPSLMNMAEIQKLANILSQSPHLGKWVEDIRLEFVPHRWSEFTDEILKDLCVNCTHLKYLRIDDCKKITDAGIQAVAQSCHDLKEIMLHQCMRVTDLGIMTLAKSCPNLEFLDLSLVHNISDKSMHEIAHHCKNLTNLFVPGTRITESGIAEILAHCHALGLLDASSCYNIVSLDEIMEKKPSHVVIITDSLEPGEAEWDEEEDEFTDEETDIYDMIDTLGMVYSGEDEFDEEFMTDEDWDPDEDVGHL